MRKALVTGGAGFIGSHLVEALVNRDYRVTVLDNLKTGNMDNLYDVSSNINFIYGDIRDMDLCREIVPDQSIIFHQAALTSVPKSQEDPLEYFKVNQVGTMNLLTLAAKHKAKFIFASSGSVYGDTGEEMAAGEGWPLHPESFYANDKRACEALCKQFGIAYNLDYTTLRYFNVYGPRDNKGLIYHLVKAIKENRPITVCGDGSQVRDYVSVFDVVKANLLSIDLYKQSVVNIGTGVRTSVLDMIAIFEKILGKKLVIDYQSARDGDVQNSVASNLYAKFRINFSELEENLRIILKENGL